KVLPREQALHVPPQPPHRPRRNLRTWLVDLGLRAALRVYNGDAQPRFATYPHEIARDALPLQPLRDKSSVAAAEEAGREGRASQRLVDARDVDPFAARNRPY